CATDVSDRSLRGIHVLGLEGELKIKGVAKVIGLAVVPSREASTVSKHREKLVSPLDCSLRKVEHLGIEQILFVEQAEIPRPDQLDLGLADGDLDCCGFIGEAKCSGKSQAREQQILHATIPRMDCLPGPAIRKNDVILLLGPQCGRIKMRIMLERVKRCRPRRRAVNSGSATLQECSKEEKILTLL